METEEITTLCASVMGVLAFSAGGIAMAMLSPIAFGIISLFLVIVGLLLLIFSRDGSFSKEERAMIDIALLLFWSFIGTGSVTSVLLFLKVI